MITHHFIYSLWAFHDEIMPARDYMGVTCRVPWKWWEIRVKIRKWDHTMGVKEIHSWEKLQGLGLPMCIRNVHVTVTIYCYVLGTTEE